MPETLDQSIPPTEQVRSRNTVAALCLAAFFAAVGGLAAYRAWLMLPDALDLGYFTTAIRELGTSGFDARVDWASSAVLGDHFSPLMVALFPLSALESFPVWLVVLQALAISTAAWIVWRFASARVATASAALITAGAALHPATLYAAFIDVHMNVFGLPLVVGAMTSVASGRSRLAAALGAVACFVREDLAAIVLLLALLNWGVVRRGPGVVMLASSGVSLFLWRMLAVDHGADRLFGFVDVTQPLTTAATALGHLIAPITVLTLALLALPWILFRDVAWRICMPVIAVHIPLFFADWAYARTISHHYYIAIPFAFAIAIAASGRSEVRNRERRRLVGAVVALLAVVGPLGLNAVTAPNIHSSVASYVRLYDSRAPLATTARQAVECVDVSTSVAADSKVIPWLAKHEKILHLPSPFAEFAFGSGDNRVVFSPAMAFRPEAIITFDDDLPLAEGYLQDPQNPYVFWSEPGRSCAAS